MKREIPINPRKRHRPIPDLTPGDISRFLSKVATGSPDECWPFDAHAMKDGHRLFRIGGRIGFMYLAHRIAYKISNGPFDHTMLVRHSCDNPPCCNPNHLVLGTESDNAKDKVDRDRTSKGIRSGRVRLTEDQVMEIRRRYAADGHKGVRAMGREFGIRGGALRAAAIGINWKHLPMPSGPTQ